MTRDEICKWNAGQHILMGEHIQKAANRVEGGESRTSTLSREPRAAEGSYFPYAAL